MNTQERIEAIRSNYPPENYSELREALDHCLTLLEAEAEERLTVLPCRVGDVLYEVDLPEYGVIVCEVLEVLCINKHEAGRKDAPVVECVAVTVEVIEGHGEGSCYSFDLQDFGKSVFLTREEAEAIIPADRADEPVICTEASPASWGRYGTGKQRAYFAVSIKHSAHKWHFGMPLMLWGYKHTEDDEARCFCGYTLDPDCAEWYALGDFELHGYTADVVKSAPVKLDLDFCRKYKAFDTVLVPAKDIYDYWRLCGLLRATEDEERSEP